MIKKVQEVPTLSVEELNPFADDRTAEDLMSQLGDETRSESDVEAVAKREEAKYKSEELLAIYDTILFEGSYSETFKGRGITVTFRSRTSKDSMAIGRALDKFEGKSYMTVQNYANFLTLIYSIEAFNGTDFSDVTPEKKYEYFIGKPDAQNAMLFGKLSEFDEKISLAIEEGRKNF